ncbi:hypothetical protein Cfor_08231, partial [Coptotermes formosanus]
FDFLKCNALMLLQKKGKLRISSVKRSNLKHTKLSKQGKLKYRRHKKKSELLHKRNKNQQPKSKLLEEEEEQSDHAEELLQMVEKDDLEFLQNAVTSHSYSLLNHIRFTENEKKDRKRKRDEDGEDGMDVEGRYEEQVSELEPKRTKHLLPIKTKGGLVFRSVTEDVSDEHPEPAKEEIVVKPKENDSDAELESELKVEGTDAIDTSQPVSTAELLASREDTLCKRRLLIGVLASGLLENPQSKTKNFKRLLDMMNEDAPELRITVRKLIMVSLLEVFKDVIPTYQIKHQDTPGVQLKKETLKLQGFEKSLLSSYRIYLQRLEKLVLVLNKKRGNAKAASEQELRLGELALNCMCDLLVTHPYFNFSHNLVQMLVPYLNHHLGAVRQLCADSFSSIFKNDKRGEISLEIVRRINRLVKSRSHSVHSEVLKVLLSLRIKDINLEKEKEDEMKQKKFMKHKQKLLTMSKKERKRSKKLEELERELLETKAEENKQAKQQHLTEVTKLVFTIYFRVLKKAPSSKILCITLEGLARYAHCINLEFYEDIVNVLNQLLEHEPLGYREQLHCIQTVFTILSGQGEVLHIDPFRFYVHLYRNLLSVHAVDILLDPDSSVGQGMYFPELEDPEYCNASNAALWELIALQRHYHPTVRKFAHNILLGIPATGNGCLQPELTKLSAEELYTEFNPSQVAFRPPVPIPKKAVSKVKHPVHFNFRSEALSSYVKEVSERQVEGIVDFSLFEEGCGNGTPCNTNLLLFALIDHALPEVTLALNLYDETITKKAVTRSVRGVQHNKMK